MRNAESEQPFNIDPKNAIRRPCMRGRRLALVAVLGGSLIPAAAPTASAYGLLEDTSSVPMAWMHVQTATSAAATITLPPDANGTTKPPPCPTPAYPGGPVADIGGCLPACPGDHARSDQPRSDHTCHPVAVYGATRKCASPFWRSAHRGGDRTPSGRTEDAQQAIQQAR